MVFLKGSRSVLYTQFLICGNMIIGLDEENIDEEIFQVDIDSNEKKIRSSPLHEITNGCFIKQMVSKSPELNTGSDPIEGNLLEVNYQDTT